jgi:DNA polymerase III subunit alpha
MATKLAPSIPAQARSIASEELLTKWCRFGWRYRKLGARPAEEQAWYAERVKYELALIAEKDFADYFLMISDAIRYGKDHGVAFGPGRGSAAASVVCWLTRITEIDPWRHQGMLFERFIDISRADPPDIDVDCSDEERGVIREYLAMKYGPECVGQIANFVLYRGKNSLQDVCRVYSIPIAIREAVASRLIERSGGDSRLESSIEDTVAMFPDAAEAFRQYPDLAKAMRLEGNVRGMSVHAAGIIVANSPLTDICAVYEKDGVRCISFNKYDAEYVGALKLDFLGLSTMGMIARCLKLAGLTLEDLYAIPDTDEETINVFRRGDVTGVFQFEGRATRLVNRDVCPDHFPHIADINALSRPGPLFSGQTAAYVAVRHGRMRAERLHPMVDDVTRDTYGQIIYQEQILRILKEVGGFNWFSVGQIRRIISKKLGEAAFQMSFDQFVQGARDLHGIDPKLADKIWKRLVTSGTYSFNIAHAISYSMLAFWTAWLKVHYPMEFYAASLAKADAPAQFRLMKDALAHSIDVKPPSLEHSKRTWAAAPGLGLVAGWEQVPGIGALTAERIEADLEETPALFWDDLARIKGIGPTTVMRMEAFANEKDPFGLYRTERTMRKTIHWIKGQRGIPNPTHNGSQIAAIHVEDNGFRQGGKFQVGPRVIYAGIVRMREYKDIVEDQRSRTGKEIEEILAGLKHPELIKNCSLRCYDVTEEEVYLRINRFKFPKLKRIIDSITVNHDVVVAVGNRIAGFGTPIMVEALYVVNPD